MTPFNAEKIASANKEAMTQLQGLAATAFSGFEKFVDVTLEASRAVWVDSAAEALAVLDAKNPRDALAAQASLVKPLAEKTLAYGRTVYAIASETSAELGKAAEGKAAEVSKAAAEALENLAKNAPAGSETAVAAMKSALSASQQVADTVKATAKQAVAQAEQQLSAAADALISKVKTGPRRA